MKLNYFNNGSRDEFACNCGTGCGFGVGDMKEEALLMIDIAREYAGVPFKLNRAISCPQHNADVGGSETSSHLLGYAFDIDCNDSVTRYKIITALLKAGFTRLGVYNSKKGTFIHTDCDPHKLSGVIW